MQLETVHGILTCWNQQMALPSISNSADPFRLTGLSFVAKSPSPEDISPLSLASSHVLLTALTNTPTPEIVLLLLDLWFSVLLALPVSSTFLQPKDIMIKLSLVRATNSRAPLVLYLTEWMRRGGGTESSKYLMLVLSLYFPRF